MQKQKTPKNQYLPGFEKLKVKEFGGSLLKGNPREARPISVRKPMHLTMRSSMAKGSKSFLQPERARKIQRILNTAAKNHGVKVFKFANAGNHLHFAILPRSKKAYLDFIRTVTGLVARATINKERGKAKSKASPRSPLAKFWDARPYTKILEWGREFTYLKNYLAQNTLEALGFITYQIRGVKARKYQSFGHRRGREAPA